MSEEWSFQRFMTLVRARIAVEFYQWMDSNKLRKRGEWQTPETWRTLYNTYTEQVRECDAHDDGTDETRDPNITARRQPATSREECVPKGEGQ